MDSSDSACEISPWPVTLCLKCRSMTATLDGIQNMISRDGYYHHYYEELRISAELACAFCRILWGFLLGAELSVENAPGSGLQSLEDYHQIQTVLSARCDINDDVGIIYADVRVLGDICIGWRHNGRRCHFTRPGHLSRSIKLHAYMDEDEDGIVLPVVYDGVPSLLNTYQHSLETSVTSTHVTESIRRQLSDCLETHGSRCPSKFDVGLPSRVIDVDSNANSERLSLHIRVLRERSQYAALSYCWGNPPHPFISTTDLIRDPSQRDWSLLPATIQDAIRVTRGLGLRYLWVDSLCIVQDDANDKMKEIQLMGMIYKNATVTIAASRSPSVNGGFLADIQHSQIPLPFVGPNGEYRKLWVHTEPPELPDEPLDKRGWTLQESLLSPRILFYGSKDLIWKCRDEPFHSLTTHHTYYRPPLHERLPPAVFNIPSRDVISTDGIWLRIQAAFLSRRFKLSQDRFFALTGVAQELQRVSGDIYIAGMWKSTIMKHLCWKRTNNIVPNVLALQLSTSPSWSWLAHFRQLVTLPIDDNPLDQNYPQLLSWSLKLADESAPLGFVLGGRLRIIGTVLKSTDKHGISFDRDVLTLDWDIPSTAAQSLAKFVGDKYVYLYLGRREQDQLGLLLYRLEDGSFVRHGHLLLKDDFQDLWANPLAQRTEIDLV